LAVTSALALSANSVAIGQTLTGTATLYNPTNATIVLLAADIAARPPNGTNQGGPFLDIYDDVTTISVTPGATFTVFGGRQFAATDPTGSWYAYLTVEDANSVFHDSARDLNFTVLPAQATSTGSSSGGVGTTGSAAGGSSSGGSGGFVPVDAGMTPMPVISFGVPAYASSGTPGLANDNSYDTQWRSNENTSVATPSWIAYDLSSVPAAQRGQVDVVWYNGNGGYDEYDNEVASSACTPPCTAYNEPADYMFEGNAAPGGALPDGGWVTLLTVTGNTYISRGAALDLTGYNWLQMFVTGINGTTYNTNTALNLDVQNAAQGLNDAWLFLGDSITAFAMRNDGAGISAPSFSELINTANPSYFPAAEGAGEGGWTSATPLTTTYPGGSGTILDHWLSTFPGHFVCLSYGTNDGTDSSGDATPTYNNFVTMLNAVVAAGKVPCIPHVPWATDTAHQTNAQLINAQLDQLYLQYPQVVKGPDLYGILQGQTALYQDNLHPNPQGRQVYRQSWATAMLAEVYP
jgi:hypothetical protein